MTVFGLINDIHNSKFKDYIIALAINSTAPCAIFGLNFALVRERHFVS